MTDSCVFFWTLAPSECASWVQAWGTIAALAVSIGVWWWQSARARDDRVQAEIERLTERTAPALGLLDGLVQEVNCIVALAESEAELKRVFKSASKTEVARFQSLLDEFMKVEAHTFPDALMALKAAQSKEAGLRLRNELAAFDNYGPTGGMVMSSTRIYRLKKLQSAILECRDAMRRRLVERAQLIINPDLKRSPVVWVD